MFIIGDDPRIRSTEEDVFMPTENKIGANIASLRRARGLTQAELARQLHYTHQTVSNWERGISEPDAETLLRLSAFFGVSADEILIGRQGAAFAEEGAEEEKEDGGVASVHIRGACRVRPAARRRDPVLFRQGPVFGAGLRFDRRVFCSWRSGRGRAPVSALRISRSDSVLLRRGACLHGALLVRVSLRVSSGA